MGSSGCPEKCFKLGVYELHLDGEYRSSFLDQYQGSDFQVARNPFTAQRHLHGPVFCRDSTSARHGFSDRGRQAAVNHHRIVC